MFVVVVVCVDCLSAFGGRRSSCVWMEEKKRKEDDIWSQSLFIHSFIHSFESRDIREVIGHDGSFFRCFVLSQQRAKSPSNNVQNNAPHPIRRPSTQIYNEVAGALPSNQSSSP
jgi:hypothetical protein